MDLNNDRGIRDTVIVCCVALGLVLLALIWWKTQYTWLIAVFVALCIAAHFTIWPKRVKT